MLMEFSLNKKNEFSEFSAIIESDKSMKHKLGSIEGFPRLLCVTGAVITSLSLTQEVAGLNNPFNYEHFLPLYSTNLVKRFRESSIEEPITSCVHDTWSLYCVAF